MSQVNERRVKEMREEGKIDRVERRGIERRKEGKDMAQERARRTEKKEGEESRRKEGVEETSGKRKPIGKAYFEVVENALGVLFHHPR
jgi:hypothetical protein